MKSIALVSVCISLLASVAAHAQQRSVEAASAYPSRPIRFIMPFVPGGGADTVGRVVGARLAEAFGQQVVVDNRGGAGGNIAAELTAKSAPDGYTILETTLGHAISMSIYRKPGFDLLRDFDAVTELATIPFLLVVNPSVPATSVKELVAFAKAKPGSVIYASSGNGGPSHLAMELFKSAAQFSAQHVPYKGAAPALIDVAGGQVQMIFTTTSTGLPMIKAGKLRPLGLASLKRAASAPDIPTFDESGIKQFEASTWIGAEVPRGTPQPIIARLHAAMVKALRQPETVERLGGQGWELIGSTPQEFTAYIKAEIPKWADAVSKSGARAD